MANETTKKRARVRECGIRELARITGYSPAHICEVRKGTRISRPLHQMMKDMGLKFKR